MEQVTLRSKRQCARFPTVLQNFEHQLIRSSVPQKFKNSKPASKGAEVYSPWMSWILYSWV